MRIPLLSMQDLSITGQCSSSVALPILSAMGIETAALPTVILSGHTKFPMYTLKDLSSFNEKCINVWEKTSVSFDNMLCGFLGSEQAVANAITAKLFLSKKGKLFVDPAFADDGKLYACFSDAYVKSYYPLIALADYLTPNVTEAQILTDSEVKNDLTMEETEEIITKLNNLGVKNEVITGVSINGKYGVAYKGIKDNTAKFYFHEKKINAYHGAGDVFSSVFAAKIIDGDSLDGAVKSAADFVLKAIGETEKESNHTYGLNFEKVLKKSI